MFRALHHLRMLHLQSADRRIDKVFAWHPGSQQLYRLTGIVPTRATKDYSGIVHIVTGAVRVQAADGN